MTIELKPEQERIIREEIQKGHFRSPEEIVDYALAALLDAEQRKNEPASQKNLAQFLMDSPLAGAALRLDRQQDFGRTVKL